MRADWQNSSVEDRTSEGQDGLGVQQDMQSLMNEKSKYVWSVVMSKHRRRIQYVLPMATKLVIYSSMKKKVGKYNETDFS